MDRSGISTMIVLVFTIVSQLNVVTCDDFDYDPLSDEFINEINKRATTWRVSHFTALVPLFIPKLSFVFISE